MRIGIAHAALVWRGSHAIARSVLGVTRTYPKTTVRLSSGWTPHLTDEVISGNLDAALILCKAGAPSPRSSCATFSWDHETDTVRRAVSVDVKDRQHDQVGKDEGDDAAEADAAVHCPWLVCVAGDDQVAKPGPAIDAARSAPKGELRIYPGIDHFDIYDGPSHEAVVADEVEFLTRHLLGRSLCGTTRAASEMSRVYRPASS